MARIRLTRTQSWLRRTFTTKENLPARSGYVGHRKIQKQIVVLRDHTLAFIPPNEATVIYLTIFGATAVLPRSQRCDRHTRRTPTVCFDITFDDLDNGLSSRLLINLAKHLSHRLLLVEREM